MNKPLAQPSPLGLTPPAPAAHIAQVGPISPRDPGLPGIPAVLPGQAPVVPAIPGVAWPGYLGKPVQPAVQPGLQAVRNPGPGINPIQAFFNARSYAADHPQGELPAFIRRILERPVSFYKEKADSAAAKLKDDQANGRVLKAPRTNVAFILDSSSSMLKGKSVTIEGFNRQVKQVQEGAGGMAGDAFFTEVQFSDEVVLKQVAVPLEQMPLLNADTYLPDGSTALFDALGRTIEALLETPGIDEPQTATLVTLFTDGEENCSRRYGDPAVLKALIERLEATGRWTFALVGPSGSVNSLADLLSISQGNVAAYEPASVQSRQQVFDTMACASATYMSLRRTGETYSASLFQAASDGAQG